MRLQLGVVLILFVLIAICAGKSAKSKPKKAIKGTASKETKTTKHKDTAGKHKGHDNNSRKKDVKKKKDKPKQDHKKTNETTVESKTNETKANLTKELPSNCQLIVNDYSNGKILMYEYKIQMNRCIKKAKEEAEKKAMVPVGYQIPYYVPAQQQGMPGQQAVPFFPYPAQVSYNPALAQTQVPGQSQAAFAPSPMNQYPVNPAPYQQNMAMNVVARTNVPANPQLSASQANAVFAQWRASSFGAAPNNRKDETPHVPNAPGNDQFAEFMKMQSGVSSSSTPVAAAPSQQVAMAGAAQQRSQIQQQPNTYSTQSQFPNSVPVQGQAAFLNQPQRFSGFPARAQARTFFPQQFKRSAQKERTEVEMGI